MTKFTELLPVGKISEVFAADISPIKITLLTIRDLVEAAHNTMVSLAKMTLDPMVLGAVRGLIPPPQIVVFTPIRKTIAVFRTEHPTSLRDTDLKHAATLFTNLTNSTLPSNRAAHHRTGLDSVSFRRWCRKIFGTNYTLLFDRHIEHSVT